MIQGDKELRSEIESLRAILLAKAGDIEGRQDEDEVLVRMFGHDTFVGCANAIYIVVSSPNLLM